MTTTTDTAPATLTITRSVDGRRAYVENDSVLLAQVRHMTGHDLVRLYNDEDTYDLRRVRSGDGIHVAVEHALAF